MFASRATLETPASEHKRAPSICGIGVEVILLCNNIWIWIRSVRDRPSLCCKAGARAGGIYVDNVLRGFL